MKKHRAGAWIIDALWVFGLRIKLIVGDRMTLFALVSSLLIFSLVLLALSSTAEEHSAIPIGIVDYDKTKRSDDFVERVAKVSALRVVKESERELRRQLLDELIYAVFVIEEGFEEQLIKGNPKELITVYFIGKHRSTSIIADILAGEMMYPVTLYKSIRYYEGLKFDGAKLSAVEYEEYINQLLKGSSDFDFAFNIMYENSGEMMSGDYKITNAILYNQLIFGILGVLVSFIAMFLISSVVREKELGVEERLRISKFTAIKQDIGNYLSLLLTEGILALIFSGLILHQLKRLELTVYLSVCLLILLLTLVMGSIFIMIAKMTKSIITYQMVSSILILITGGLGFYRLLSGLSHAVSSNLLKFIPNSWFIQGFTDIIVYGNHKGILLKGHGMLALLAAALMVFIITVDLFVKYPQLKKVV